MSEGTTRITVRLFQSDGITSDLTPGHYWSFDRNEDVTQINWKGPFETIDDATDDAIEVVKQHAMSATKDFFEEL